MDDAKRERALQPSLCLPAIHLHSLSELERVRLQEISICTLREKGFCNDGWQKTRKIEKRKHDQKDSPFGMSLSDVIAKDHVERHRILPVRNRRACAEVESSVHSFLVETQSNILNLPMYDPITDDGPKTRRRGGLSVDSISELDGSDRLLEALQLSHPAVLTFQQEESTIELSLNPIYKQVPRIVESCCSYIEKYGLQTVGIFRIGGSKKRVEQLRKEFAYCGDTLLGEDTCVHDISAVLKGFLRELPEPLLPQEFYTALLHVAGLDLEEMLTILQLSIFALPPRNADTLLRILQLLHNVSLYEKDTVSNAGNQIPGNKMSITNIATVFGPTLLRNEKSEGEMQSFLESAAQIKITETMIQHYKKLYLVPSYTHCELMISLLQTDSEVVDFLLRRKSSSSQESEDIDLTRLNQHWKMHTSYTSMSKTNFKTLMNLRRTKESSGIYETPIPVRNALGLASHLRQPKNSSRDYFQKDEPTEKMPEKPCAPKEFIEGLRPENCTHVNKPGTPRRLEGNSLQPKNTLRDYFQKTVATSTSLVHLESLRPHPGSLEQPPPPPSVSFVLPNVCINPPPFCLKLEGTQL